MSNLSVKPTLQAMLLADNVYKDVSGKHIIAGTFSRIINKFKVSEEVELPEGKLEETQAVKDDLASKGLNALNENPDHRSGSGWIYLSLTNIRCNPVPLEFRLIHLKDFQVVMEMDLSLQINSDDQPDPTQTVEYTFPFVEMPKVEGVYSLDCHFKNELIGSLRIYVQIIYENGDDV